MYKIIELDDEFSNTNEPTITKIDPDLALEKTASTSTEIKEFLASLRPHPAKTYLHINAVGSVETYGCNKNGDAFPRITLEEYHKTYEHVTRDFENQYVGNVFKDHVNKNARQAYGKVLFSYYNPRMERIELIVELINSRLPDIIEMINNNIMPKVSMGMTTPHDQCSVCGNRAKTLAEYCDHLKFQMKRFINNGKQVYAINPMAKFFDISFVGKPAWDCGAVLQKVASTQSNGEVTLSAELGKAAEDLSKTSLEKESDIVKEGPFKYSVRDRAIIDSLPDLGKAEVSQLSKSNLENLFATLARSKAFISPKTFQDIVLMKTGSEIVSEEVFNPFTDGHTLVCPMGIYDKEASFVITDNIEKLAVTRDNIINNLTKLAERQFGPHPKGGSKYTKQNKTQLQRNLGSLYSAGYKHFSDKNKEVTFKSGPKGPEQDEPLVSDKGTYKRTNPGYNLVKILEQKGVENIQVSASVYKKDMWDNLSTNHKHLTKTASVKKTLGDMNDFESFESAFDLITSLIYK
jgi:hypothetical protein